MNKTEMLTLLESRLGSRGAAVAALDAVLDEIQNALASGERVTLTGFGTFERVERPARTGRNPRTGTAIEIPAAAAPRFHAGAGLRAAVAGPVTPSRARAVRTTSGTAATAKSASKAATKPATKAATKVAVKAAPRPAAKAAAKPAVKPSAKAPAKASSLPTAVPPVKVKSAKPTKADKKSKKSASEKAAKASGSKKKKK